MENMALLCLTENDSVICLFRRKQHVPVSPYSNNSPVSHFIFCALVLLSKKWSRKLSNWIWLSLYLITPGTHYSLCHCLSTLDDHKMTKKLIWTMHMMTPRFTENWYKIIYYYPCNTFIECHLNSQVFDGCNVLVKKFTGGPTADVAHLQKGDRRAQVFGWHQSSESGCYMWISHPFYFMLYQRYTLLSPLTHFKVQAVAFRACQIILKEDKRSQAMRMSHRCYTVLWVIGLWGKSDLR